MSKLLPKHELFCQEYVKDCDGTASYIRAYGNKSLKVAGASAPRVLARPDVKARVAELQAELAKRNEITVDMQLAKLDLVIEAGMKEGEKGGLSAACRAIEVQSKHLGFMVDKVHVTTESMSDAELAEAIRSEQGNSVIPWAKVLKQSKG